MAEETNERFNELKQFSPRDAQFLQILEEVGEVEQITVHHIDFTSGDLIISINSNEKDFDGIMDSVKFCAMNKRITIKSVDFDNRKIKIQWLPDLKYDLTQEEINCILNNRKIAAIKLVRERRQIGLADAKHLVERHWEVIRQQGV